MSKLNPDVYAGDVLRAAYREQMDRYAAATQEATELRAHLERAEADKARPQIALRASWKRSPATEGCCLQMLECIWP